MVKNSKQKIQNHLQILQAIQDHRFLRVIEKQLEINYNTLYYQVRILEEIGLIHHVKTRKGNTYGLTPEGKEFLLEQSSRGVENLKLWRLHANGFQFEILEKPKDWDRQKPKLLMEIGSEVRQARLNNNTVEYTKWFNRTCKVMNNHIEIYINRIYAATPEEADAKAIAQLEQIFPRFERKLKQLGIVVRKPQFGVKATNTSHYAREHDEIACALSPQRLEATDRRGELRATSDRSHGFPELEFPHPHHAPTDARKMNEIIAGFLEGDLDPFKDKEQINELYGMVLNLQKLATKQITSESSFTQLGEDGVGLCN